MLIISIIHSFRFSCFRCLVPGLGTKQKAKWFVVKHLAFSCFTNVLKLFPYILLNAYNLKTD